MASWCYVCRHKVKQDYRWLAGEKVHPRCWDAAIRLFEKEMGRPPSFMARKEKANAVR